MRLWAGQSSRPSIRSRYTSSPTSRRSPPSRRRRSVHINASKALSTSTQVNRRTRSDPSPLFIYLEFPGVNEARAFGTRADDGSLPGEFLAFWEAYIGTQPTVWSSMVLLEALEVVAPDKWASLMERGKTSPCPLPPPPV